MSHQISAIENRTEENLQVEFFNQEPITVDSWVTVPLSNPIDIHPGEGHGKRWKILASDGTLINHLDITVDEVGEGEYEGVVIAYEAEMEEHTVKRHSLSAELTSVKVGLVIAEGGLVIIGTMDAMPSTGE